MYEGNFFDGKRNGYGVMVHNNGDSYSGQWSNDCIDGKGTLKYINGDKYEGDWVMDQRHGKYSSLLSSSLSPSSLSLSSSL